jgi:iron-sulfur cluster repair protein YtfE (RIC family)
MQVTDALLGEHGVFHLLVEQLDDALGRCQSLLELRAAAEPLAIALLGHARIEEEALFQPYEAQTGSLGPLMCLRHEHQQMDQGLRALFRITEFEPMRAQVTKMLDLTRRHLAREEAVMFAAAEQALAVGRLEELGANWARFRGVALPDPAALQKTDT